MISTSAVTSKPQVDTADATLECLDTDTEDSAAASSEHKKPHRLLARKASQESLVKDTDSGKPVTARNRLKRKKLTDDTETQTQQTATDTVDDVSQAVKSCPWKTSKKLLLTPPTKVRHIVEELSESSEASCVNQRATRASRLTRKVVSCDGKQHVDAVVDVSEEAAQQLAAEPRVIVHNIKPEPDCSWNNRIRMSSMSASDEASDGEVIVKETIVIASDDPPPRKQHLSLGIWKNLRTLKDYEANARRLLKDYDGTQSVDVEELFDECNMSEVIEKQDIIEIDDDDEWSQMPVQLASVRSTVHCFVVYIVDLTLM